MKVTRPTVAEQFRAQARHSLQAQHLPRIRRCLNTLSAQQIWWRAHPTTNGIGNLVLHLAGNVRQWIICGLGGQPDLREREREFGELGPFSRRELIRRLEGTVSEACRVIANISSRDLGREYRIQGFRVTGFSAIAHVTEHFAYHAGQIIYATKLQLGADLRFTRLPGDNRKAPRRDTLSQY